MNVIRARSPPPMPLHQAERAPRLPGCYCIWSSSGQPLYVGRSVNLNKKLRQRATGGWWLTGFTGADRERYAHIKPPLKRAPEGSLLTFWVVGDLDEMRCLELLLIGLLKPVHNRRPNAKSASVLRVLQGGAGS